MKNPVPDMKYSKNPKLAGASGLLVWLLLIIATWAYMAHLMQTGAR